MKKKTNVQHSFMHGSLILLIATALVKVIGAVYRIPLANLLDESGMGYYSTAYDLYLPMYSLAMAGLPVAISRIVAEHIAAGRYNDVAVTLKVAKRAFWVTGGTGFLLMCLLSGPFISYTGNSGALLSVFCIAPCLLVCCIMSAYRGYYEGLKNMTPTAISQVLEALGKLILGYGLAFAVIKIRGDKSLETLSIAAAGALFGITLGTVIAAGYLIIKYHRDDPPFTKEQCDLAPKPASGSRTLKALVAIAVPIVLGSFATYITSLIDVVMVQRQLAKALADSPEIFEEMYKDFIAYRKTEVNASFELADLPNALYGVHRGYAYSIYNLVPVITSVLGVSAIPILASAWTKKDSALVKSNIETIFRTTALIAFPAGLGIFALSGQILSILYSSEYAVSIATPNLRVLGVAAVFAGLTIPMTSMLQAIGKQKIPVRNIAVGAVIKIVVNFAVVGIPSVNIKGVPYGTLFCYAFIFIANFISLRKYSGVKFNVVSLIVKPFVAGAACAAAAYGVCMLGDSKIITLAAICVAVVVYIIAIALLKAVEREDVLSLPKGETIAKLLEKVKIIDRQ